MEDCFKELMSRHEVFRTKISFRSAKGGVQQNVFDDILDTFDGKRMFFEHLMDEIDDTHRQLLGRFLAKLAGGFPRLLERNGNLGWIKKFFFAVPLDNADQYFCCLLHPAPPLFVMETSVCASLKISCLLAGYPSLIDI